MAGKGGGGAWKVAYADFVTAMMAFFMVMWITAQNKEVKEAVALYFRQPTTPTAKSPQPGPAFATYKHGASLQGRRSRGRGIADPPPAPPSDDKDGGAGKPHLLAVQDGKRSTIGATVLFAEDSAELGAEGQACLKRLVPSLAGKLNKIEIRGHASRRPLPAGSPFQDPWQLCYARCLATMKCLEQEGIEPTRLRLAQAGPFEAPPMRGEPETLAENSRVEVYVLADFAEELAAKREDKTSRAKGP